MGIDTSNSFAGSAFCLNSSSLYTLHSVNDLLYMSASLFGTKMEIFAPSAISFGIKVINIILSPIPCSPSKSMLLSFKFSPLPQFYFIEAIRLVQASLPSLWRLQLAFLVHSHTVPIPFQNILFLLRAPKFQLDIVCNSFAVSALILKPDEFFCSISTPFGIVVNSLISIFFVA